jgi:DNA-binding NarL/FixJ family response regulator
MHFMSKLGSTAVNLILVNIPPMSADLLRRVFEEQETIQLVGYAATLSELVILLNGHSVDVALVGSSGARSGSRQGSGALPFLEQMATMGSAVRPIVMADDMAREDVVSFLRNGARGLICESQTNVPQLVKCIGCVSGGQLWASAEQVEQLLCSLSQPHSLGVKNVMGDSLLSQREEQVLDLLAHGMSNRDLARTLKLSEHTVKNHLFRIFDKLGVSNRMEAVLYAISNGQRKPLPTRESSAAKIETKTETKIQSGAA